MPGIEIIFLGVWIFLAWMVWKKKIVSIYLKALKTFLLIAGISGIMLIVFLVGVILYNVMWCVRRCIRRRRIDLPSIIVPHVKLELPA